ncbi:MAG: radical SAM protein [Pseudomonadota bacterium]
MIGGNLLRQITQKAYANQIPLAVNLELIFQCNERCKHCYIDFTPKPPLAANFWFRCLDELVALETLILTISGGEPLLHPDFADIYKYAHEKGFSIRLFSNLLNLNDDIVALLDLHKPFNVQTSLYGHTAELHDEITNVKGSFAKTVAATKRLLAMGIPVLMKTTWMQPNIDSMDEIERFVFELGAIFQGSLRIMAARSGDAGNTNLRLTPTQLVRCFANQNTIPKAWSQETKSQPKMPASMGLDEEGVGKSNFDYPCGAAIINMRIAPDGKVYPCVQFNRAGGDATRQNLGEIWRTSSWFQELRGLRQSQAQECGACSLKEDCFRCPADAYTETGDPLGCSIEAKAIVESYLLASSTSVKKMGE